MTPRSTSTSTDETMFRQQLSKYSTALTSFTNSPSNFRILQSIGHIPPQSPPTTPPSPAADSASTCTPQTKIQIPQTLYVLDSSFNPPTLAHQRIAISALLHDSQFQSPSSSPTPSSKRLLILLSTQNADKAPKPASFPQRLLMMQIFASDLLSSLSTATSKSTLQSQDTNSAGSGQRIVPGNEIGIDIAVTKLPYFVDKSIAIEDSGAYAKGAQQVHLTGYDTLIRILDPKYYPPSHTLNSLHAFLSKHRLRVTYRTDDSWGERASQDQFLKELGEGKLEGMGGKREWVTEKRIVMCEGRKEGEEIVSSTRVREAVRKGDRELLEKLATGGVAKWILGEGLYLEEEGKL